MEMIVSAFYKIRTRSGRWTTATFLRSIPPDKYSRTHYVFRTQDTKKEVTVHSLKNVREC